MVESDIARLARLSGLDTAQVRYDLKEYCKLKGNQLEVTISDDKALKIISEKPNTLIWINGNDIKPDPTKPLLFSDGKVIDAYCECCEGFYWAYITPDMLPKGGIS